MNPNETLADARRALKDWESAEPGSREESEAAERLGSAFGALDDWLGKGGYPPTAWTAPTPEGPARRKLRETNLEQIGGADAWWLLTELKRELT